ncbi:MAG: glycosyltransferase family 2 protein [bacterium]|nr:glycosyltransferase family 2 protein [bacterium]
MTTAVAAALANWNGGAYLPTCLAALEGQTRPLGEIVIVDNGSTDGSVEWLAAYGKGLTLLRNPQNEGYCHGYNRAIAATDTPYVLVLNTDVYLDPGFVEAAIRVLDTHAEAAAVTGCFYEQATERTIGGGFRLRRQLRMRPEDSAGPEREVFGASGAAVLFRRAALVDAAEASAEFYDPRYFSYGEDIDLAWRLRSMGWTVRYAPEARAHHVGSGSLGGALRFLEKPAVFQRHALKNRYLTLLKNAPPGLLVEMGAALLLTDLALWPFLCLRQPWRVPYLLGGIIDVIRLFPGTWRRRRVLQARSRLGSQAVRPWLQGL